MSILHLPSAWIVSLDKDLKAEAFFQYRRRNRHRESLFQNVMQFAADAFDSKDYDKAITFYKQALDMRPDDVTALTVLGNIYLGRHRYF